MLLTGLDRSVKYNFLPKQFVEGGKKSSQRLIVMSKRNIWVSKEIVIMMDCNMLSKEKVLINFT